MAHFNMLIRPEEGSGIYPVSLWAMRGSGQGQRLYTAPQASWLEYSQRLEQAKLMGARDLGRADACIFRGEPMVQRVQCSPHDLTQVGFGEAQVKLPRHLRMSSLLNPQETDFIPEATGPKPVQDAATRPFSGEVQIEAAARDAQTFRERIALLGVSIDNLCMDEVVERIDGLIDSGGCHQVATANVDFLTKAFDDCELLDILHSCELVVADGMPLVWASHMLGVPLKERVTGADLVPRLLDLSARKQRRIFLLGATEENSCAAAEQIKKDYPDAVICGRHSPPFTSGGWMEDEKILQLVRDAQPDLLLVAFGNPKQEKWIARHRDRLKVPVCIGVGASIDFLAGWQSRAPLWMQRFGMEWVHRLVNEPRRLALRYLNNGLFLLRYLSVQLMAHSLQPRALLESRIKLVWQGAILTVEIAGGFCGSTAKSLFEELEKSRYDGSLVLDMTASEFITPDAAGMLVCLTQRCIRNGNELWIAGAPPALRSVLQATFPAGEPFRVASTMKDAMHFVRSPLLQENRRESLSSEVA